MPGVRGIDGLRCQLSAFSTSGTIGGNVNSNRAAKPLTNGSYIPRSCVNCVSTTAPSCQLDFRLAQMLAQFAQSIGRQSIGLRRERNDIHHQADIDRGVASHRESQLRLIRLATLDADDDEAARVENGCQRREPRLVVSVAIDSKLSSGYDKWLSNNSRTTAPIRLETDRSRRCCTTARAAATSAPRSAASRLARPTGRSSLRGAKSLRK